MFDPVDSALTDDVAAPLLAILTEWRRSDLSVLERKANIENGAGLTEGHRLDETTVRNDSSADVLNGGSSLDWRLLDLDDDKNLGPRDEVFTDLSLFPQM